MFAFVSFVLICAELLTVDAQTPTNWGPCPDHPTVDQFDLEKVNFDNSLFVLIAKIKSL